MSFLLNLLAHSLRPEKNPDIPTASQSRRILVIRRNRLGDMICTLPLLHALRKHDSAAHVAVACDPAGAPIARACPAVDEVIVLQPAWTRWLATMKNAARLQDYGLVIAAKGGFDRRLATLARLTNAPRRIGFGTGIDCATDYYTDPVAPPENPHEVHQIETALLLLRPLGITDAAIDLSLSLPTESRQFAESILAQPPFASSRPFMLINLSSTTPLKFSRDDFAALIGRILDSTDFAVGLVAAPADQSKAGELAAFLASPRVIAVATPGPLELAALLERASLLLTPEGGAAHLAAAMKTSAVILWSEGPFQKWRSRGENHIFIRAEPGEKSIPLDRVWQTLQTHSSFPS